MSARRKVAIPSLLIRFWAGVMALTALSAAYTIVMTRLRHSPHPWGVQLLWGEDVGWDLNIFRDRFLHFRTPVFWQLPGLPFTYPAAAGVIFGLLYKLAHPRLDYLVFCSAGLLAWMWWLVRRLASQGVARGPAAVFVATAAATCWPLWVLFNSANIEGLVAILLGAGLIAFVHRRRWLAAWFIGIAGAMKIFPLIMLALLLSKRRYSEFFGGIAIAVAVTIASLAILGPSIPEAQHQINLGLRVVTTEYALAPALPGPDTNHSLYMVVRTGVLLAHHLRPHAPDASPDSIAAMLRPAYVAYFILSALAGLAAYIFRIRHLPVLSQMLALSVCAVTLPPLSRDYTLIHLFVPFGLLCIFAAEQADKAVRVRGLAACLFCFAFIFTEGTYFGIIYSLTSPFRVLALLGLLAVVLSYPFHASYLDEPDTPTIV